MIIFLISFNSKYKFLLVFGNWELGKIVIVNNFVLSCKFFLVEIKLFIIGVLINFVFVIFCFFKFLVVKVFLVKIFKYWELWSNFGNIKFKLIWFL